MKKNFLALVVVAFIVSVIAFIFISLSKNQKMVAVKTGNIEKKVIPIQVGKFQDGDCGMVIDDITYTSEVILDDGKTLFFHDFGNLAHWLQTRGLKDKVKIWVFAKDVRQYIDAKKAWFSRNEITPMESGFGAYKYKKDEYIDFDTMFLLNARGETMKNPQIRKKLLGQ